jgi:hypothetical protein
MANKLLIQNVIQNESAEVGCEPHHTVQRPLRIVGAEEQANEFDLDIQTDILWAIGCIDCR